MEAHDRVSNLADREGISPAECLDAIGMLAGDDGRVDPIWVLGLAERRGLEGAAEVVRGLRRD